MTDPAETDTPEQRELIDLLTAAIHRHHTLTYRSPNPNDHQEPTR